MLRHLAYTLLLLCACALAGGAHTKRALLIGISSYPGHKQPQLNWSNIHGANDVNLLAPTLRRQGFATATLTNRHATAQAIRAALAQLARQVEAGDLVYIQFSGHGQPVEDQNGDEPDGWDEAIVPYNAGQRYLKGVYEGSNHITDDELNSYVTAIRKRAGTKGYVYVVLDACHMGGASRGADEETCVRGSSIGFSRSGKPFAPRLDARSTISIPGGEALAGACYIEACRSYQSNTEITVRKSYYGPLSYYVNMVLTKHKLTPASAWVNQVKKLMEADHRLATQNIVVERSVK